MHVLGYPGHGHVIPMLPILAELVRRGERVICYETAPFEKSIRTAGAEFRDYGSDFPLASPNVMQRFQKSTASAIQVQLETSQWALEHLLEPLKQENPRLIVHDSLAAWGWYLARALRIPSVSLFPTFAFNYKQHRAPGRGLTARVRAFGSRLRHANSRALADRLSRRYDVPYPDHLAQLMRNRGQLNLIYTSREFQPDGGSFPSNEYKFIGPSITARPDAPPFPFDLLDRRPLVYISLGTAFRARSNFFEACIEAFRNTPYQIVMATGQDLNLSAPPHFFIRRSVPQLKILKRAFAFVTHGGMNSVNESLYFNVPMVLIPQGGDHAWVAARTAELGAGIVIPKDEMALDESGGLRLSQAVMALRTDHRYAAAAKKIGASLRATGGASEAGELIANFMR